jgi:hypothetical protein
MQHRHDTFNNLVISDAREPAGKCADECADECAEDGRIARTKATGAR